MAGSRQIPALIEVVGLSASYGRVAALKPVDLRVDEGEFVTVLGPNGAGKTTLLRIIAGLEFADSGTILFNGEDTTHRNARDRVDRDARARQDDRQDVDMGCGALRRRNVARHAPPASPLAVASAILQS